MSSSSNPHFAILASGEGSNALALLENARRWGVLSHFKVLICDVPDAPVLKKVQPFGLPCVVIAREKNESRRAHEQKIEMTLRLKGVTWILLAGYLRILSAEFIAPFENKIINIHPSLLPAYPGLKAYERAFNDGVSESGVSVHLVTPEVDAGKILLQQSFSRMPGDSLQQFIARGKELEHQLYSQALAQILKIQIDSSELI